MEKARKELDELIRLAQLDSQLRAADVDIKPLPLEEALQLAKEGKALTRDGRPDGRKEAGKKRAKKNASRRKKAVRQQRWKRNWKARTIEQALDGNYYAYLRGRWMKKQRGWDMSEEEWLEHVQPCLPKGAVVELRRYDVTKPASLDNIIVYDASANGLGAVLFDGKEHALRMMGAIL